MFDVEAIRKDFPILQKRLNGNPIAYLDNAATSQKPLVVLKKLQHFYSEYNANIRRGISSLSGEATRIFEDAREYIKTFFNAKNYELVFTKNTTEAINLVAYSLVKEYLKDGDEIVLSEAEHHSNIVPFHLIGHFKKIKLKFIQVDSEGYLDLDNIEKYISARTKLISITHISNVLGILNPVEKVIEAGRSKGIPVLIDGAQSAPHIKIDLDKLSPTFFAFSAHKMLGPAGVGLLFIHKEFVSKLPPFLGGGGMITEVEKDYSNYLDVPYKFEGGTIDAGGIFAFVDALEYIKKIGFDNITSYEKQLTHKTLQILQSMPEIEIYGTKNVAHRIGVISFNMKNIHPHDLNTVLDADGIIVRSGHHCAQLLMKKFNVMGTVRVSFYLYNTYSEIDRLKESLEKAVSIFKLK